MGQLPEKQPMVLELRGSGYLRTADHLIVAKLSEAQLEQAMRLTQNRVNVLIRCQVSSVDPQARRLANLEVLAFVPSRSRLQQTLGAASSSSTAIGRDRRPQFVPRLSCSALCRFLWLPSAYRFRCNTSAS